MTPDDPEDDRTVIRPPGQTVQPAAAGFEPTQWVPGSGAAAPQRTQATAPPAPEEDMGSGLPVGTRLGEFEITSLLGEGGFGIVYLAHDHSLQRRVALKEYMPSSLAARSGGSQVQVKSARHRETFAAGLKSFINEARLLASFDHPSLVKVYRFWEANGTAYMVMPYYEGQTLRDVLRAMPRPPDEQWLRTLLLPLTEALGVIHAEQCYHRDIAPDNVMMLAGANPGALKPLLLDFGAARRVIGDMTQALTVILKPGYAPVEQYAEIPGMKQGAWTDVYALAAVVYFAIMGKTPPPSVGRLLKDNYQPLVEAAAGRYSERFLAAIDRALAVRPEERTQSVGELRSDLGLGELNIDAGTTRPMPLGEAVSVDTGAAGRTVAASPRGATSASAATAATASRPGAAPAAAAGSAPPAGRGKGALVGIGVGVVALAAVGIGVYSTMKPAPSPAPATVATAAPPPATVPAPASPPLPTAGATPAPAPAPTQSTAPTTPPVAAPAVVPPPAPAPFEPTREFDRIVREQTAGFGVRAEARKTELKIGRDEFQFNVVSERDGFLTILGYSADGTLAQLVPNTVSGTVRVRKGQSWRFPTGDGFFLATQEPPGPTQLLVMVSASPRNLDALQPRRDGPVRLFPTGSPAAALAAAHAGPQSILAGKPQCPAKTPCDDAYGAALLRFDTQR